MSSKVIKKALSLVLTLIIVLQVGVVSFADEKKTTGVEGFVNRLYENIMSRDADSEGLKYWTGVLKDGSATASSVVDFFFTSPEFKAKGMSDEEYIDILYVTIMDRESDAAGNAYWLDCLSKSYTRRRVLSDFLWSDEFTTICKSFGVTKGAIELDVYDLNPEKVEFIKRSYQGILGRSADNAGLSSWLNYLMEGHYGTQLIVNLISSDEFKKRNLSDEEYIACLYVALLGREASEEEIAIWVDIKNAHQSSQTYVLKAIAASSEFATLCQNAGIEVGTVDLVNNRDMNTNVTDYVINASEALFGRSMSDSDLDYWTGMLLSSMCAKDFINYFLSTEEFSKRHLSDADYIAAVYSAALGREAGTDEIDSAKSLIKKDGRQGFINMIFASSEFATYCSKVGVSTIYNEGWNNANGGRLYFQNGETLSGWQYIDGVKYYFDPANGNLATSGWKYVGGFKYYFNEDGSLCQDVRDLIGDQNDYYLTVNCTTNTVMVYAKDENGNFVVPVTAMICSTGAGGATPAGSFRIERLQSWRELMGDVYGQYCSRINGNILFHSVWYYTNGNANTQSVRQYRNLGTSCSHGCVRLTVADAKWIFDNCNGCAVTVTYSNDFCPFDKPVPPQITAIYGDYGHDPTDIWR